MPGDIDDNFNNATPSPEKSSALHEEVAQELTRPTEARSESSDNSANKAGNDSQSFAKLSELFGKMDQPELASSFERIASLMKSLETTFKDEWKQDSDKIMGPQSTFTAINEVNNPDFAKSLLAKMSKVTNA